MKVKGCISKDQSLPSKTKATLYSRGGAFLKIEVTPFKDFTLLFQDQGHFFDRDFDI